MSKNNKRINSITEAVGDTSGFSESGLLFGKSRKITLIAGCAGLLVLIVAAILLFTTPQFIDINKSNWIVLIWMFEFFYKIYNSFLSIIIY